MAIRQSSTYRNAAERSQVTHEWLRACEELHGALITPVGLPPRQWAAKVALAHRVDALFGSVVTAWRLFEAPVESDTSAPGS